METWQWVWKEQGMLGYKDIFPKGKDSTQAEVMTTFLCILLYACHKF
jgi:hypothetical protein